ncbi:Apulose-4-phosphate transketolase subunit B [Candidatus Magnetaquicoccaceae bacterium FCR-1]|uniref:Apulose-4-phosphate transketolase subunit B n=1 Tax=Candidatus Magnetaquiglobus chichijimensis TaxID=3141448 RepID=A0ABQ0CA70_9PROT
MRNAACASWVNLFRSHPFVFMTGDLGFQALEPLRQAMGERFINAGIAEQNMISVAAGMARHEMLVWVYSIAPFCYARPFEQIRNDLCQHDLPVKIVGNGGGYGYGAMGATHHALEDYGALLTLPNMLAYVPIFASDVDPIVRSMAQSPHPGYLRLGRCEMPTGYQPPAYAPWRRLLAGDGTPALTVGPLTGGLLRVCLTLPPRQRPEIWGLTELPVSACPPPEPFLELLRERKRLVVIEEHVTHGGIGHMLAHALMCLGMPMERFVHVHALGYPSHTYGSQAFHRQECGLDPDNLLKILHIG